MGYQLIEHIEVGSGGAASIEFTGIPQDGVSLVLLTSLRGEGGAYPNITLNGTSANYSGKRLTGGGDYVSSGSNSVATSFDDLYVSNTDTANTFGSNKWYFSNYAGATAKSVSVEQVNENNATSAIMVLRANLWNDTAAITSIELNSLNASNEFAQYSTASLFKITAD
jgi:hypothetical protein